MSMTEEDIEELRDGTKLTVEPDPDDERYMVLTYRRPKAPEDPPRESTGDDALFGFLKIAGASLVGSGVMKVVEEDGREYGMVDITGLKRL